MAQYAVSALGVPVLIFRKLDTDLRTLVTSDFSVGDQFVRLAVLYMISRGLASAQSKGVIIHQDLKPENILINFAAGMYSVDREFPALIIPKINDFELTNNIGNRLRGFRPYLPAEHFQSGDASSYVSDRYDIYSLAVIAHELLTCGYHPMPCDDERGLHCSAYVGGYQQPYRNEERWKKWARAPAECKPLPAITDRSLASALRAALDPDFKKRPTASAMAEEFKAAMERQDPAAAKKTGISIDFLEQSGETGSGAEAQFPNQARKVLSRFPEHILEYFG
jgi:serine/threonine protein kinase